MLNVVQTTRFWNNLPRYLIAKRLDCDFDFWYFNATFSNISAISWRPVIVVEEARREPPTMGKQLVTLSLAAASRVHPFCNLQSWARTHAALVIGLYGLLGNPTT